MDSKHGRNTETRNLDRAGAEAISKEIYEFGFQVSMNVNEVRKMVAPALNFVDLPYIYMSAMLHTLATIRKEDPELAQHMANKAVNSLLLTLASNSYVVKHKADVETDSEMTVAIQDGNPIARS